MLRQPQALHCPELRLHTCPAAQDVFAVHPWHVCVAGSQTSLPHTVGTAVQSGMHTPSLGARPSGSGTHTYDPDGDDAISLAASRHGVTMPAR